MCPSDPDQPPAWPELPQDAPPVASSGHRDSGPLALDKDQATRAVAWSMLFALIAKICFPLVSIYYISRTLGPIQLGMFFVLNNIVQFSEVLRDAGLQQTFLAEKEMDEKTESSYHFVAIVAGIVPMVILVGISNWLARFMHVPEYVWALPLVSAVCLINGFATVPKAKMLRDGRIKRSAAFDLIGAALGLATAVVLVSSGAGFVALIVQMLVTATWGLILVSWQFRVRSIHVSLDAFRAVGKKSLAVLGANGINNIFLFGDQFVIGRVVGPQASGLYGAAMNIAMKPAELFAFPLTRTLMVAFSQSAVDADRLKRIFGRALTAALLLVLPLYALLGVFSIPIIDVLLGPKYAGSAAILSLLSVYLACRVLGNISGHALVPAGKHFLTLYPWFGCIAVTGAMIAWAIPQKSAFAMAIAFTIGAVFVYLCLLLIALRHCMPELEDRKRIGKAILVLVCSVGVMVLLRFLPVLPILQLVLALLLGPFVHLGLIGTFLAGKTLKYLTPRGPRELWNDL